MCLAVPGKIEAIKKAEADNVMGNIGVVDFQGNKVEVSLQLAPDAVEGDWVLVHAGFALEQLDEAEARELWDYLQTAEVVDEIPEELKESSQSSDL
ncbi:MAG: HypC/HybG/HupF family hydrogenase formation chaperone [Candidatus Sumerlaeia bacterium]